MKQFFKENFVLAMGIALPLVLIVLFYIAGQVSRQAVADPQYDALFAVDYHDNASGNPYSIAVDNDKLVIKYRPASDQDRHYAKPRLFRFDHETQQAKLIDIDFDAAEDGVVTDPDIAALNENKIDPNPSSPDGYQFEYSYNSGGLFSEFFGGYNSRNRYVLSKGPRRIPVQGSEPYWSAHFIGWVVSQ